MSNSPAHLRQIAEAAALAAGTFIVAQRPKELVVDHKSTVNDAVTQMDRAAEELIVAYLAEHRPEDAVLGEEHGTAGADGEVTWVIDPIDGTVNYVYGIAHFAVSVAAVTGGTDPATWQVLAGAVCNPSTDTMWSAGVQLGATKNGVPIRPQNDPPLGQALVGTGFGYAVEQRAAQAAVVGTLLPQVRDIRRFGSAALDLCAVADGQLDAYYEQGLGPWDYAAGTLIVAEAGRKVSGFGAHSAPGRAGVLAGAPTAYAELMAKLV